MCFQHFIIFHLLVLFYSSFSYFCNHLILSFFISRFICGDLSSFYFFNIFHLPIFLIFLSIFIILSSFCHVWHILWILTNFITEAVWLLHQNILGKYRCYPQMVDWFHDIYVDDHQVIISRCLNKFEVRRELRILKAFLVFHDTLCCVIDSFNLI